jgi:MFS family permease
MSTSTQTVVVTGPPATLAYRVLFAICLLCYLFGGLVSTLMSVYLPVVISEVAGPLSPAEAGRIGAYINALFLFGWMLGGIGFGILGDRRGRVQSFLAAVGLYGTGTVLTGWAGGWETLVACRLLTGAGVGGVLVLATVLVAETWPVRGRNVALGILAVAFPVGILAAGAVNNLVPGWREAFGLGVLPLAVGVVSLFVLKEPSPRERPGGFSPEAVSPRQLLGQPVHRRNLLVGTTLFGATLVGLWAVFSWMPTWVQSLFADPAAGGPQRGVVMMLLGGGGIVGGCLSGLVANRLGYRRTLLLTFGGSFVTCVLLFATNRTFSPVIYAETAALALFFGISQGALSAYLPALFPAAIRATATGLCFNLGRLLTATAVFFVGTLVAVLGGYGNAVLVFSLPFLLGALVTWREVRESGG